MLKPLLAATALALTAAAPAAPAYHVTGRIAGPDGAWDYASVDPAAHRLYVARGDSVTVIDTASGTLVGSIGHVARGHAAVPLPNGRLLVTSGNDDSVRILDTASGQQLATIAVGKKPDAAILDPATGHALVMDAAAGSVSEIDVGAMKVVRTIAVKPGLEFAQVAGRTLFINNEDANEIEVVDLTRGTTGKPIPLPGCEGPSGLGYDAAGGRLVSACANGQAAVVDVRGGRLVSLVSIGIGPDAVIMDAAHHLAMIPCGKDGVLDVLALDAPRITRVGRITTEVGARTGAIDPSTRMIYLPTAAFGLAPAQGRAPALAGTFHVLVLSSRARAQPLVSEKGPPA